MNREQMKMPEQYKSTHVEHKVGDKWYLVPNKAITSSEPNEEFECWLYNSNGSLATGVPYLLTKEKIGL